MKWEWGELDHIPRWLVRMSLWVVFASTISSINNKSSIRLSRRIQFMAGYGTGIVVHTMKEPKLCMAIYILYNTAVAALRRLSGFYFSVAGFCCWPIYEVKQAEP